MSCTLGVIPHSIAAVFGLSRLVHAGANTFRVVKFAGAAYLLFLAVSMFRTERSAAFDGDERVGNGRARTVAGGVLLNLLNPKLTVFFCAFLQQFVSIEATTSTLLTLGAVLVALTPIVFAVYAVAAARLRDAPTPSSRMRHRLERSMAATLAAFAIRLAFTDQ